MSMILLLSFFSILFPMIMFIVRGEISLQRRIISRPLRSPHHRSISLRNRPLAPPTRPRSIEQDVETLRAELFPHAIPVSSDVPVIRHGDVLIIQDPGGNLSGTQVNTQAEANALWNMVYTGKPSATR